MLTARTYTSFKSLSDLQRVRSTTYLLLSGEDQFNSIVSNYHKELLRLKAKQSPNNVIDIVKNLLAVKLQAVPANYNYLHINLLKMRRKNFHSPTLMLFDGTEEGGNLIHLYGEDEESIDAFVVKTIMGNNIISLPVYNTCPVFFEEKPVYVCRAVIGKLTGKMSLN